MYIEISEYGKRIGKKIVLENINLQLSGGNVYGLCGVNASGKTMLLRAIAGLIRPTTGRVMIDGKLLGKEISFPPSVGILLESPSFLDSYTGQGNLELLAQIKNEIGKEQICEVMKRIGLDPDDERKYKKYSLGMKQKLGIAAAVMEHPKLILLDEPTNSLDERSVEMLISFFKDLRDEGALIVVTSHDKSFLYRISDVIYHIDDGKIEECIYAKE